jgi:hypothetical protein
MGISRVYKCDQCDRIIASASDGYVIQGNIYVADPDTRGGLVGNNFPKEETFPKFNIDDVRESVFCRKCFAAVLGLDIPRDDV